MSISKTIGLVMMISFLQMIPLRAGAEGPKGDFSKEPVRLMTEIYRDYHDWKTDDGIAKTEEALSAVSRIYDKDREALIHDKNLRLNKAYQVKSTLHTLLGMLYYRKSLAVVSEQKGEGIASITGKMRRNEEITDRELEDLDRALKADSCLEDMRQYLTRAQAEFQKAIDTDSANPSPHFQLAGIYSAMKTNEMTDKAEQELVSAAQLSGAEGDRKAVDRAMETLRELNPNSVYLKKGQGGDDGN
ncbi:MAG: hypothetical protein WC291_02260 [Thermodesulfovibrionales bacterium]|jgi:hypothetical protein